MKIKYKYDQLLSESQKHLVGGVNSPVRAFNAVSREPIFALKGEGPFLINTKNEKYIDYVLSYGPLITGHAHPEVIEAGKAALEDGTTFGTTNPYEVELSKAITNLMPSMQKNRFVNSGTESCMSAIRLARGYTNKKYIIKFDGCYHGHADQLLISAGSGNLTLDTPDSAGVLQEFTQFTLCATYNDIESVAKFFKQYPNDIAAVVIEPVAGNMGLIKPVEGFLKQLRDLCTKHHSLLVFDEVMTGFRVALGGAQSKFDIEPDLTCLGKVIGGGMPCAVYGGKAEIMNHVSPVGKVYQAGTLSGNPIAMRMGLKTMEMLTDSTIFQQALSNTDALINGTQDLINKYKLPLSTVSCGTMFCIYFNEEIPKNLDDVKRSNFDLFKEFFNHLMDHKIYLPPSQYESCFMSGVHTSSEIEYTLEVIETFFQKIK